MYLKPKLITYSNIPSLSSWVNGQTAQRRGKHPAVCPGPILASVWLE